LAKGFSGREVRYQLLTAYYRANFNFTLENLAGAKTALARIDECVDKLRSLSTGVKPQGAGKLVQEFTATMDEDLNVSSAWARVFDWVSENNRLLANNSLTPAQAATELAAWDKVNSVLGIGSVAEADAPAEIVALLDARQAARKAKDFKRSDQIRDELKAKGWIVEDSPKGPKLKKL
jgi:cysteinyl-tRNA synthetase